MSRYFFAWVGGEIDPAFTLTTVGDIWSGTLATSGDLWNGTLETTGDLTKSSGVIGNLADITSLRVGVQYEITASGLPLSATFTYEGGFSITLDSGLLATVSGVGVQLKITNSTEVRRITNVDLTSGMQVGKTYNLAVQGVVGATFVWDGSKTFVVDKDMIATQEGASITISSSEDLDRIQNIGTMAGLVSGEVYSAVGIGIPAGATFTYGGEFNTATLFEFAVGNGTQIPITISKGATESDGGAFDATVHAVEDEFIYSLDISQAEGQCAEATVLLVNPRIGLLAATRRRWCWISRDDGSGLVTPLLHGRLVGVPEGIKNELVQLKFVAKPGDFMQQKAAIAKPLRVLPYFDPVWISHDKLSDPDSILEARSALYDVDPVTLTVALTDILVGEAGTIEITEAIGFYEETGQTYSAPPIRQLSVFATVTWSQTGEGDVDITDKLVSEFISVGSPYLSPIVGTFTSDGLLTTWPQPNASLGGGWSIGASSLTVEATWIKTVSYTQRYLAKDKTSTSTKTAISVLASLTNGETDVVDITPTDKLVSGTSYDATGTGVQDASVLTYNGSGSGTLNYAATSTSAAASLSLTAVSTKVDKSGLTTGYKHYDIVWDLLPLAVSMSVHWLADRKRSETLSFTLTADMQTLITDTEGQDIEEITMSSAAVAETVDAGGVMPIGDPARNSYFPTDRGASSIQFLMLTAFAKMRFRARAVKVKVLATFDDMLGINCRSNLIVDDYRFPGGQATGKVIAWSLKVDGDTGAETAEATIGCTIGHGTALVVASSGVNTYADDYADSYTASTGAQVDVVADALQYESLEGTYVIDDDGVDLFNMTPARIIKSLTITGGPTDQQAAVDASVATGGDGKPQDAIKSLPTRVALELVPVTGGAFQTNYAVKTAPVVLPKTIDLEAA